MEPLIRTTKLQNLQKLIIKEVRFKTYLTFCSKKVSEVITAISYQPKESYRFTQFSFGNQLRFLMRLSYRITKKQQNPGKTQKID